MKYQWLAKLGLLIVWPPVAVLLGLMMALALALVLVLAWFCIPFATFKRKDDDTGWTATFP